MDEFAGALRALLATIGGALVANGHITAEQNQMLAGAIVSLLVVGWSVWQKRKAKK